MWSKEATVGLLVAITCLILLGISPGHESRAPLLGDTYDLVFHNVGGLRVGDPVVLGGVAAGKIVSIDFAPEDDWAELNRGHHDPDLPVVLVKVNITSGLRLPADSGYKVISNLNTNRFINILPGSPNGTILQRGGRLSNELAPEGEDRLVKTIKTFKRLSNQTEDLRRMFADPNFRREIKDMASNMRFYSREFMVSSANATLTVNSMRAGLDRQEAQMERNIEKVQEQVTMIAGRLHQTVPALEQALEGYNGQIGGAQARADELLAQARKYVAMVDDHVRQFDELYSKRVDPEALRAFFRTWSQKLDDYQALMADGRDLFLNETVRQDLKNRLKKLKDQSQQLEDTVKGFEQRVDSVPIKPVPLDPPPPVPAP